MLAWYMERGPHHTLLALLTTILVCCLLPLQSSDWTLARNSVTRDVETRLFAGKVCGILKQQYMPWKMSMPFGTSATGSTYTRRSTTMGNLEVIA